MSKQFVEIKIAADQLEGTQATFSTWLVSVGDVVIEGQPVAELETDKVSMEICAIADGMIESLIVKEGDKIEPEQSLGKIKQGATVTDDSTKDNKVDDDSTDQNKPPPSPRTIPIQTDNKFTDSQLTELNASGRELVSPAVRRLLLENNLNIEQINGSGKRGRVTRDDVISAIKSDSLMTKKAPEKSLTKFANSPFDQVLPESRALQSQLIPHSNMRKSIASHMVNSLLKTSPHVTSVFEMDMSNIIEHRKWHKKEYLECGVKLTFTAYFLSAMAKAVAKVPQVNAQFHEDALEIFSDVNIGVGTALGGSGLEDSGLVVPVVQQVQAMNLFQIAKSLNQQTEKARTNKLRPSDMKNGTLTISNYGVSGSILATPIIINQPQVAILGIGKLEKRVVVEDINGVDTMVIKPKCYVSLSIDHRALDAHQTNLYLSEFVSVIENWGI